jgi:hypothetical protein
MVAEYLRDPPRNMTIERLLVLVRFFEEYAHTSIDSGAMPKSKDKLHKVIRFLMEQHADALGKSMGKHHGQAFPKAVADTRNYHTHFNPALAVLAATGPELVILIDRLWLLARAVVLGELGYDDLQIAAKLNNDRRVGWLAAQP